MYVHLLQNQHLSQQLSLDATICPQPLCEWILPSCNNTLPFICSHWVWNVACSCHVNFIWMSNECDIMCDNECDAIWRRRHNRKSSNNEQELKKKKQQRRDSNNSRSSSRSRRSRGISRTERNLWQLTSDNQDNLQASALTSPLLRGLLNKLQHWLMTLMVTTKN